MFEPLQHRLAVPVRQRHRLLSYPNARMRPTLDQSRRPPREQVGWQRSSNCAECGRMLHFAPVSLGISVIPKRTLLRFQRWSTRRQLREELPRCFHSVPIFRQPDPAPSPRVRCTSGCGSCVRIETQSDPGNENEVGCVGHTRNSVRNNRPRLPCGRNTCTSTKLG